MTATVLLDLPDKVADRAWLVLLENSKTCLALVLVSIVSLPMRQQVALDHRIVFAAQVMSPRTKLMPRICHRTDCAKFVQRERSKIVLLGKTLSGIIVMNATTMSNQAGLPQAQPARPTAIVVKTISTGWQVKNAGHAQATARWPVQRQEAQILASKNADAMLDITLNTIRTSNRIASRAQPARTHLQTTPSN